jgi:hypothetical protein
MKMFSGNASLSGFVLTAVSAVSSVSSVSALAQVPSGAEDPAPVVQSIAPILQPAFEGVFRMYSEPRHVPNAWCDLGTRLVLDTGKLTGKFAVLENFVAGLCKVAVYPDTRYVALQEDASRASCGSKVYVGTLVSAKGLRQVEITDHRRRLCRDLVPARVIVKETDAEGVETVLYATFHAAQASR